MRRRRLLGGGSFSPLSLFTGEVVGAWYEPSDYSTLFQEASGATAVSAVGQSIGLILDKSKSFALGSELNDGLDVLANWTVFGTNTIAQDGDAIKITYGSNAFGAYSLLQAAKGLSTNLTVGQWYKVTGQAKVNTGSVNVSISTASVWNSSAITSTTYVDFTIYFLCDNATTNYIFANNMAAGEEVWIRGISVKSLAGNHAYQLTSAARPIIRAEDFIDFDGSNDLASVFASGGSTTAFFLCTCIYLDSASLTQTIWSDAGSNTGFRVRINSSNQLEFSAGNGSSYTTATTTETVSAAGKYLITVWHDGSNLNAQLGNATAATTAFATATAGTSGFTLGRDNGAASNYLNGRISATIYVKNSALTEAQRISVQNFVRNKAGL